VTILEYMAVAGVAVLVVGVAALAGLLGMAARPNDDGARSVVDLIGMLARPAGPPWPEPGTQSRCPNPGCHGRRCASWRRRGIPCGDQSMAAGAAWHLVGLPLPRDGRHAVSTALVRWLAGDWWEVPLPVRLRRRLGRTAGAARTPVQHGFPVGKLP
jgi:hypothetical protein